MILSYKYFLAKTSRSIFAVFAALFITSLFPSSAGLPRNQSFQLTPKAATPNPYVAEPKSTFSILVESSGILAAVRLIVNLVSKPTGAVGVGQSQPTAMFFSSSNDSEGNALLDFFSQDVVTPFPYNPDEYKAPGAAIGLAIVSVSGIIANLLLFFYIIWQKLYKNFISSHFIAHFCITNAVALAVLSPMLVYSFWYGDSPWILNNGMCRLQVNAKMHFSYMETISGLCNVHGLGSSALHGPLHCRRPRAYIRQNPLRPIIRFTSYASLCFSLDRSPFPITTLHN